MLRDGATWRDVAECVARHGYPRPSAQNVTNFRKGYYRNWLLEQSRLDEIRARAEAIRRELDAHGFADLDKAIWAVAQKVVDLDDPVKAAGAIAALKHAIAAGRRLELAERELQRREEALRLEREKFAAAQRRAEQADKAEAVIKDNSLSHEERERKIRQIFGLPA